MTLPLWVIIPAAGVGQRMQASCPKQYLSLAGHTILDRTIDIFISHPLVAGVLVGISAEDAYWSDSKWCDHDSVHCFVGGKERSDTVQEGLRYLFNLTGIKQQDVLVHDAARPLLTHAALERIIHHHSEQGALLAVPSKDTVKRQQCGSAIVETTLDRNIIWLAQTPQRFPARALLDALEKAQAQGIAVTDECSAMEFMGWHPDLVVGENSNIKITLPEDVLIAEALFTYLAKKNLIKKSLAKAKAKTSPANPRLSNLNSKYHS
ncbi:2-C-methyl-D-erythritol 4-phosphate cytidylyltransferase [Marinomonas sp. M1K-6]|uniref:2-C-methyl-D-erythritol 4-phosphate cytidylyltransferase n=1 Tax=Marinomonas profundi TaxID=2726122 RepID=A0A847R2U1_9GAMM|nr:2-C-methyl-D-erythritol 4-phosphate cytidylyltransferase [Marinomonas profundi]NLQ18185.1 2-C-methyl-D-erythritol 4-phosphate cytidylyltransferase [Marinomonas profundi]UDV03540.1 2-C-methyl-D-erythritol 4-phosphate cytidylyltransferase [Marinomonas profundi]